MKITFSLLFITVANASALAQNEEDALRIGTTMPGGTARSAGMANAFGALGADGVSIAINPAGMAVYRTSELSFTPALEVNDATAVYHGSSTGDTETRFHFSNLILAINNPSKSDADWRSSTYGIAFDRQATNHWRHNVAADNVPGSLLHYFHDQLSAYPNTEYETALPFTGSLAWWTYGLDTVAGILEPAIPFGANTDQVHSRETRGATSNTSFFYSGNYKDRLYIGASIGIVGHRFRRTLTHQETYRNDTEPEYLDRFTFHENLTTSGNGFEAKVGAIGRITDRFRIGLAFHSPQWLQMSDSYVMDLTTYFPAGSPYNATYQETSPDGIFNYRLVTPWKGVFSAAYIIGKQGLFSIDHEYQDMRNLRFRASSKIVDTYDFRQENEIIEEAFVPVHNIRVGTEWRTGAWYYRAGFGYRTDPYSGSDLRHGRALTTYAAGIGYRAEHVSVDLGFNYGQRETRYFTYGYGDGMQPVVADLRTVRTLLTIGFRP